MPTRPPLWPVKPSIYMTHANLDPLCHQLQKETWSSLVAYHVCAKAIDSRATEKIHYIYFFPQMLNSNEVDLKSWIFATVIDGC